MRIFQSAGLAEHIAAATRPSSQGMHFVNAAGHTLMIRRGIDGPGPHGWAEQLVLPSADARSRSCARALARFPNVRGPSRPRGRLGRRARRALCRGLRRRALAGAPGDRQPAASISACTSPGWWSTCCAIPRSPRVKALPDYTVQLCDPGAADDGGQCRRRAAALGDHADAGRRSGAGDRARHLLADDGALARPRGCAASSAPPSTPSIRWCRRAGARATCCWPAMPATRRRPSSARACAPACATRPISPGSSPRCCASGAPDSLLDTYESERAPHVRTFIELAVKLGAVLQETDPAAAAARDRPLRGRHGDVRLPAAAARPGLPRRRPAARRHDLPAAAPAPTAG